MFQVDRLNRIKEFLHYYRSADVGELSTVLKVSEVTVRRDLEKLEQEGFLERVHGGAIILESQLPEEFGKDEQEWSPKDDLPSFECVSQNSRMIGETAAELVDDYEVVFIGASLSAIVLARAIKEKQGVVVLSNYLPVCLELLDSRVRVIMVGGELDSKDATFKTTHIDYEMCMVPVEKAFVPFRGFDLKAGYAFNDKEELEVYKRLQSSAKYLIGMMEGSLFDKQGFITTEDDEMISAIVTDQEIPDQYRNFYFEKNIIVYEGLRLE